MSICHNISAEPTSSLDAAFHVRVNALQERMLFSFSDEKKIQYAFRGTNDPCSASLEICQGI